MNTDSGFKYVFWGLVVIFAASFLLLPFRLYRGLDLLGIMSGCGLPPIPALAPLIPLALLVCIYVVVVAVLVHRDARKRGMDPWLWATVAAFVPYLIGVIIYLVARSTGGSPCIDCGRRIQRDFVVCPYCGTSQQTTCPDCRKIVRPDWKACPYCGRRMGSGESPPNSP
jgi:RNA polymerase subunit RPABC4/transcription elongation factor Spt4